MAVATALHTHRQLRAGDRMAVGADEAMQLVLDHERHDHWDVDHLVAERFRIIPTQRLATTAAVAGMMENHVLALLGRKLVAARTGMALLATAPATRGFALPLACGFKTAAITGWRPGLIQSFSIGWVVADAVPSPAAP